MDKVIAGLKTTTFAGRRFTKNKLVEIQETVNMLQNLSLTELSSTICEHLNWRTPSGSYKIGKCTKALVQMSEQGLFNLPEKKVTSPPHQKEIVFTSRTIEQNQIESDLEELEVQVLKVTDQNALKLWNEYIDRYHYLGYKKPIGDKQRYFIVDKKTQNKLGCLIFASSPVKYLECRDNKIGWDKKAKSKRLNMVLNNTRFLIFPWVKVDNLASKALSIICKKIAQEWQSEFKYTPVLLETFVDPEKYKGTCYQASNWMHIGQTIGYQTKKKSSSYSRSKKDVYLYPLRLDYQAILSGEKAPKKKPTQGSMHQEEIIAEQLTDVWQSVKDIITEITDKYDKKWIKRHRKINSMILMFFIFRLVLSHNTQSYQTTINQLWDQFKQLGLSLPQKKPLSSTAFYYSRYKLDPSFFKEINEQVVQRYILEKDEYRWKSHHIFSVDGSKINVPKTLKNYPVSNDQKSRFPQGLLSCLYHNNSKTPCDFIISPHHDERKLALEHLEKVPENSIVIYDRGYFSFELLHEHSKKNIHPVFRLSRAANKEVTAFFQSDESDQIISLEPPKKKCKEYKKGYQIKIRLVKYFIEGKTYVLGTTLFDSGIYSINELKELYHQRWFIEELYKISKNIIDVEDFHAQFELGIKQEIYAHFCFITLTRLFNNKIETELFEEDNPFAKKEEDQKKYQVNQKNALATFARHIEELLSKPFLFVQTVVKKMIHHIASCKQAIRPNRQYNRKSKKVIDDLSSSKKNKKIKDKECYLLPT